MLLVVGLIALALMGYSVARGLFLGYGLTVILLLFSLLALKKGGMDWPKLKAALVRGAKQALPVTKILALVGLVSSGWMACGCVGTLVNWGISILKPELFILLAFLFSCGMSFLIGSSFATVSTMGIVLIVLARAGGVNTAMVAGAIVSGAYFGDRCSPMSSSLILIGSLSKVEHGASVRVAIKSGVIPLLISAGLYLCISPGNPLGTAEFALGEQLAATFRLGLLYVMPAILLLILAACRVKIVLNMTLSLGLSIILALVFQKTPVWELVKHLLVGFSLPAEHPLSALIHSDGLWGMVKVGYILLITCAFASVLEKSSLLGDQIHRFFEAGRTRTQRFLRCTVTSLCAAAVGCNQTIAIVMATDLMRPAYGEDHKEDLLRDVSCSAQPLAATIPWNIAVLTPVTILGMEGIGYWPYLFLLFAGPLYNLVYRFLQDRKG